MNEQLDNPSTQSGGPGALGALLLAPFLAQADATIANVATPAIRSDLGGSGASVALVVGGYLIAYAVLVITGARLGQIHGYRRMYKLGMGAFGLSSLLAGLAGNVEVLITARILQGASAAMMNPQTLIGIQVNFVGRARARAITFFAAALSTGAVLGQIFGGVLITADLFGSSWRSIFLVNVPIVILGLIAAARTLRETSDRPDGDSQARLDYAGVALLTVATLLLIVPLILGPERAWPVWSIVLLVLTGPGWVVFVVQQLRRDSRGLRPLVNIRVISARPVLAAFLALLAATATYYALLFVLAQFVQRGLNQSPVVSGLILVPCVAAFGLAGQLTQRLPSKLGSMLPFYGYVLLTIAYFLIAAVVGVENRIGAVFVVLLAFGGLGLGVGFATLFVHLADSVSTDYAADISGVTSTTLQIGGALGIASIGSVYLALRSDPARAFVTTMLCAGVLSAIAAALARLATWRRARRP